MRPTTESMSYATNFWGESPYINNLEFFYIEDLFFPIYVFIQCMQSLVYISRAHEYLFHTLNYTAILLYLVAQIIPDLDIGNSLAWLLCLFGTHPSLCVCLHMYVLNTSLPSDTTRWLRLVYFLLNLRLSLFSKKAWLFLLDNGY